MASVRRTVQIHRPPEDVWAHIGDPASIATWFPGIEAATVEGTRRVITTRSGLPIPEVIVTHDDLQRRFQYRLDLPLVSSHLGTIDVIGLEDGSSLVVYSTDCEPDPLAIVIGGATGGALAEIRRQLEPRTGGAA